MKKLLRDRNSFFFLQAEITWKMKLRNGLKINTYGKKKPVISSRRTHYIIDSCILF